MCMVPGSAFQEPDRLYEGRVLKSRHATPGTSYVYIADKDNIYLFDKDLVRTWVEEYDKARGAPGHTHSSTKRPRRRRSVHAPSDEEATSAVAERDKGGEDATRDEGTPAASRVEKTGTAQHTRQGAFTSLLDWVVFRAWTCLLFGCLVWSSTRHLIGQRSRSQQ